MTLDFGSQSPLHGQAYWTSEKSPAVQIEQHLERITYHHQNHRNSTVEQEGAQVRQTILTRSPLGIQSATSGRVVEKQMIAFASSAAATVIRNSTSGINESEQGNGRAATLRIPQGPLASSSINDASNRSPQKSGAHIPHNGNDAIKIINQPILQCQRISQKTAEKEVKKIETNMTSEMRKRQHVLSSSNTLEFKMKESSNIRNSQPTLSQKNRKKAMLKEVVNESNASPQVQKQSEAEGIQGSPWGSKMQIGDGGALKSFGITDEGSCAIVIGQEVREKGKSSPVLPNRGKDNSKDEEYQPGSEQNDAGPIIPDPNNESSPHDQQEGTTSISIRQGQTSGQFRLSDQSLPAGIKKKKINPGHLSPEIDVKICGVKQRKLQEQQSQQQNPLMQMKFEPWLNTQSPIDPMRSFQPTDGTGCMHVIAFPAGYKRKHGEHPVCLKCGSPEQTAEAKLFSTLPLSQATIKARANFLNNQGHYEEVFQRVKSRHEQKRLKLPASFLHQQEQNKKSFKNKIQVRSNLTSPTEGIRPENFPIAQVLKTSSPTQQREDKDLVTSTDDAALSTTPGITRSTAAIPSFSHHRRRQKVDLFQAKTSNMNTTTRGGSSGTFSSTKAEKVLSAEASPLRDEAQGDDSRLEEILNTIGNQDGKNSGNKLSLNTKFNGGRKRRWKAQPLRSVSPNHRLCEQIKCKTMSPQNVSNIRTKNYSKDQIYSIQAHAQLAMATSPEKVAAIMQDIRQNPEASRSRLEQYKKKVRLLGFVENIKLDEAGTAKFINPNFVIKQQILAGTNERTVDLKSLNARKKRLEDLSNHQQGIYTYTFVPMKSPADNLASRSSRRHKDDNQPKNQESAPQGVQTIQAERRTPVEQGETSSGQDTAACGNRALSRVRLDSDRDDVVTIDRGRGAGARGHKQSENANDQTSAVGSQNVSGLGILPTDDQVQDGLPAAASSNSLVEDEDGPRQWTTKVADVVGESDHVTTLKI